MSRCGAMNRKIGSARRGFLDASSARCRPPGPAQACRTGTGVTAPRISVVIPAYARPARLADCLAALARTRLPADAVELVVVDDGSPEPLEPVVHAAALPFRWRVLRQANAGPAAARNAGAAAAAAPFLAFTDDDCLPEPDWLPALLAAHQGVATRMVGGRVANALPHDLFAATSQDLVDFLYSHHARGGDDGAFFTSNNIGCERARFLAIGGFDASFPLAAAEDRDLCLRWCEAGGELRFAADAVVGHAHAMDLVRFLRQHANYGRGARHLHRRLRGRGRQRPRLESIGFYARLLTFPLVDGRPRALGKMLLLALSQAAMVRGYLGGADGQTRKAV